MQHHGLKKVFPQKTARTIVSFVLSTKILVEGYTILKRLVAEQAIAVVSYMKTSSYHQTYTLIAFKLVTRPRPYTLPTLTRK